ncbi:MAG: hypothetical protein IPK07_34805 [Deltaproteobacteria bacterium]|nr:hypothetical protein [Deltaproteobacteria bacterium]
MSGDRSLGRSKADGELSRLFTEFAGVVDDATIRAVFEESLEPFRAARIQLFVPILSYRHARTRLRDFALRDRDQGES